MNRSPRPLLHCCPSLVTGPYRGGITTRVGFPPAHSEPQRDEQTREESRGVLAGAIGADPRSLCWLKQVHGAAVVIPDHTGHLGEADALVTSEPQHVLLISVADCGPVLLWDPTARIHAAVHAGWRGVLAGVVPATVEVMTDQGATASRIQVWIGPSIGVDHFEVGPEVAERFPAQHVRPPDPPTRPRPHVDLAATIRRQLETSGIENDNIRLSPHSTYAQPDLYWSYRRDRGICGRHLAFLTAAPGRR